MFSCGVFFEKPKFELSITTDTVKRITRSYLKVFHFKEILSEIQGRENITIHPDLFETIKQSVPPDIELNVASMRSILKPLKLHMLMPHSQYLINRITKRPLPYIPREKDNKLIQYFKQAVSEFHAINTSRIKFRFIKHYFIQVIIEVFLSPFSPVIS